METPATAVQWLIRAEEARSLAFVMNNAEERRMMFGMAAGYARLAE
jgi:hypothetical protein